MMQANITKFKNNMSLLDPLHLCVDIFTHNMCYEKCDFIYTR